MARLKVGVMGAQGCGKTELVRMISEGLSMLGPVQVVGELAREIPDKLNEHMTLEGQRWMFVEQMDRERMVPGDVMLVCDRTIVDPVVYSLWQAERTNNINWHAFVDARVVPMLNWYGSYDVVYWCRPDDQVSRRRAMLAHDGVRSVGMAFQGDIDRLFHRVIGRYKLDWRPASDFRIHKLAELIKPLTGSVIHGEAGAFYPETLAEGGDAA